MFGIGHLLWAGVRYRLRQTKREWSLECFYGMINERTHIITHIIGKLHVIRIQICAWIDCSHSGFWENDKNVRVLNNIPTRKWAKICIRLLPTTRINPWVYKWPSWQLIVTRYRLGATSRASRQLLLGYGGFQKTWQKSSLKKWPKLLRTWTRCRACTCRRPWEGWLSLCTEIWFESIFFT